MKKMQKDKLESLFDKFSNQTVQLKSIYGGMYFRLRLGGCSTDCQPTSNKSTSGGTTEVDTDTIGDDDVPVSL